MAHRQEKKAAPPRTEARARATHLRDSRRSARRERRRWGSLQTRTEK